MHRVFGVGMLLFVLFSASAASAEKIEISYDRSQDSIRIQARNVSLSELFAQLSLKTGIGYSIEATAAKDRISVNQSMAPVATALGQVLRRYSYVLIFQKGPGNRNQVAKVTILGAAGNNAVAATPLASPAAWSAPSGNPGGGYESAAGTPAPVADAQPPAQQEFQNTPKTEPVQVQSPIAHNGGGAPQPAVEATPSANDIVGPDGSVLHH